MPKPVGTIFVELDLDASRYTKGQQKLLKDATSTSTTLEQNFKNLGIKSAGTFDLMRAKIMNSFEAIANSSKATANDIIRAEEAKNAKLKALNEQQFGAQKGMLESMKANWMAYAASAYAAIRAIDKAVEMAKAGSMLVKQEQAFGNLAAAAGTSSQRVISDLKKMSGGMVADADLMTAAGKAMLMSIPADKISDLMRIAAATSRMTGQTITDAFNDITMGVARQSKMILDNLGIIVNVDKANQDYAKALGKTSDALSDTEKRQAFMTATLAAGEDMIKRLGEQRGTLDGVNIALAGQKNAWDEISKSVAHFLDGPLAAYGGMLDAIAEKLKNMRESGSASDRNEESFRIEQNRMHERLGLKPAGSTSAMMAAFNKKWVGADEAELANQKRYADWQRPDQMADWRSREGNFAANTDEENKALIKKYEEEQKLRAENAKKELEWMDTYRKSTLSELEFERETLEAKFQAYDKFVGDKIKLDEWYQSEKRKLDIKEYAATAGTEFPSEAYGAESARAKAYTANAKAAQAYTKSVEEQRAAIMKLDQVANDERWFKTYVEDIEAAARANEIFKDSMDIMSQSTADAMARMAMGTGTLKDNFNSMVQSIIAGLIRMSTQQGSEALFGMLLKAGGSIASAYFGGSASTGMDTNTQFSGGGSMGSFMALVKHSGGPVDGHGPTREMPSWVFAGAPRLHNGLASDEYPAILQRGETVNPKGRSLATNNVTINVAAPGGRMDRESMAQLQAGLYSALQRAGARNT